MRGFGVSAACLLALGASAASAQPLPEPIQDARADLEAVASRQEAHARALENDRRELAAREQARVALIERARQAIDNAEPPDADPGALYADVERALADVLESGLTSARLLIQGMPAPDRPGPLPGGVLALEEERPVTVGALRTAHQRLLERADELEQEASELLHLRIETDREAVADLSPLRGELLELLGPAARHRALGIGEQALHGAALELTQLALQLGYWFHLRYHQARGELVDHEGWWAIGSVLWRVVELLVILLLLRFARRRWDTWMTKVIAALGKQMHLGGGALFLARLTELARSFGPSLLVVVAATAGYLVLDEHDLPEVDVAFIVIFWFALFRMQLRFVEGLARSVGVHRAERAAQMRELAQVDLDAEGERGAPEDAGDDEQPPPAAPPKAEEPPDLEPVWKTVSRSWRLATRYLATGFVLLELIEYAVGEAVLHSLLVRAYWLGVLLVALILLRFWRHRIVFEYLERSGSPRGVLGRLAEKHGPRIYGILFVVPALAVVVVTRVARFVRQNLSNLDATKRVLAWLFRRNVEKHAQEHGHVLQKVQDLPEELTRQFPLTPLDPDDRPIEPPCLDDLQRLFDEWQEDGTDGTVALVGATGMGKTTAIRMLEGKLGERVLVAKLISKVTRPDQLIRRLARLLELDVEPASEVELIDALQDLPCRVVALDNCHNLFLRQVGGFEAWEAFTRIVNETSDKVFWVATFDDVSWDYLNSIAARQSYFRKVLELKGWTDVELRRLILSRLRRAHYRPSFTDLLVARVEGVSMSSQIIGTSHGYFRLLWDFTNGNPRDACFFWLRSLVPIDGERRVRVHLFASPQLGALAELSDDMLFTLQAIVEHENLTADELARVTNMPPEQARFAVRFCREAGYLELEPGTGRNRLSIYWHQTVIRHLRRQHLIHS